MAPLLSRTHLLWLSRGKRGVRGGCIWAGGGSHFEKGDMLMALTAESSDSTLRNFT